MYNVQDLIYVPLAIHLAKQQSYSFFQPYHMDISTYMEQFNNRVNILEWCGVSKRINPGTLWKVIAHQGLDPTPTTAGQMALARSTAKDWYLALAFIMGAD